MGRNSFLILLVFILPLDHLFGQSCFVDEKSGIEIYFVVCENMFPDHWYSEKINAKTVSLSLTEYKRVKDLLKKALAKYPEHILKENLKKVYALNSLNFYGLPYGGTYSMSKKALYITDDTILYEKDSFIESFFHHEFSSILFRKHPCYLKTKEWKSSNPRDFHYGKGGMEAIRNGNASMEFDSILNEKGFLNKYSQASLEDDINVFSQNLFNGGKEFWIIVDRYEKVKAKTRLIIGFYHKIDPFFTEDYFRKL